MFQASQWYKKKEQEKIKEEWIEEMNQGNRPNFFNNLTQPRNFNPVQQPNFNIFTGNHQGNSNFQTQLFIQQQRLNTLAIHIFEIK